MPSADDHNTLAAWIKAVDHTAREANARWGMDRLEMLVPPDLLGKFMRQQERWRAALDEAYDAEFLTRDMIEAVAKKAAALQRGWEALEAAASEAGHRQIVADVWEARLKDGTVAAVVRTDAEVSAVRADGRHVTVYTLAEVAALIDAIPGALSMAKREFPGSKVTLPRDTSWMRDGDELPRVLA